MTIDKQNYKIHYFETNKFNATQIKIVFTKNMEDKDYTYGMLLKKMMKSSNRSFKNKRDLEVKMEENLVSWNDIVTKGQGKLFQFNVSVGFLNEGLLGLSPTEKNLDFLEKILFNIKVEDEGFVKKDFIKQKDIYMKSLKSLRDYPSDYADLRFAKVFDDGGIFSLDSQGEIQFLEKCNEKSLYNFYKDMLNNWKLDVFVLGKVDVDALEIKLDNLFREKREVLNLVEYKSFIKSNSNDVKEVKEKFKTRQSELRIGYTLEELDFKEIVATSKVLSDILNSTSGKLFKEVREKHSLCYTIGASFYQSHHVIEVFTKISAENYEKTKSLIIGIFESLKNGVTIDELNDAKKTWVNNIKSAEDSLFSFQRKIISKEFKEKYSNEEELSLINSVTLEDIVKLANKIHLNTIYLLEEE